jgi:hypothetical protein
MCNYLEYHCGYYRGCSTIVSSKASYDTLCHAKRRETNIKENCSHKAKEAAEKCPNKTVRTVSGSKGFLCDYHQSRKDQKDKRERRERKERRKKRKERRKKRKERRKKRKERRKKRKERRKKRKEEEAKKKKITEIKDHKVKEIKIEDSVGRAKGGRYSV